MSFGPFPATLSMTRTDCAPPLLNCIRIGAPVLRTAGNLASTSNAGPPPLKSPSRGSTMNR
jgi:hypothetical protein